MYFKLGKIPELVGILDVFLQALFNVYHNFSLREKRRVAHVSFI